MREVVVMASCHSVPEMSEEFGSGAKVGVTVEAFAPKCSEVHFVLVAVCDTPVVRPVGGSSREVPAVVADVGCGLW